MTIGHPICCDKLIHEYEVSCAVYNKTTGKTSDISLLLFCNENIKLLEHKCFLMKVITEALFDLYYELLDINFIHACLDIGKVKYISVCSINFLKNTYFIVS